MCSPMTSPSTTTADICRYASEDWSRLAELLSQWPYKPYQSYARWPEDRLASLLLARASRAIQDAQSVVWVAYAGDLPLGMCVLSGLPWDSEQIGLPAARLDYLVGAMADERSLTARRSLLATALVHGRITGVRHLSARVDASDLTGLHLLEDAGFITVDGLLTFSRNTDASIAHHLTDHGVRLATAADAEATAMLARQAYSLDRFHSDPAITQERADELHATWLRNSCAGRAADAVVLAEDAQGLLGFVTCKLQQDTEAHLGKRIGTIALVAAAERCRHSGVGRRITLAALDWFKQQDIDIVEVGTQLRNIPASRLYESCGFRLVGSSVSLRKLL